MKEATSAENLKDAYASAAAQWLGLAEDAERIERSYPNRRVRGEDK